MIRALGPLSLAIILFAALLVGCDEEPDEAEPSPIATGRVERSASAAAQEEPSPNPANQRLAFVSNRDGAYRLYTMDPDGGDIRMLSEKPVAAVAPFSVSEDGTQIAVLGGDASGTESPCVYRVDVMGGATELLGQVPPDASSPLAMPPRWRADDLSVLVSSYEACYAVPSVGGEVRKEGLENCLETAVMAEGPQGKFAALGGTGLMVLEGIGSTPRVLDEASGSEGEEGEGWEGLFLTGLQWMGALRPVWSPDGTWIAYFDLDAGDGQRGISVIRAEGGEPRLLVSVTGESSDFLLPAAWSPDGKRVIFAGFNDAAAIQEVSVEDGRIRTLVGNDGHIYRFPQWVTDAPAPERPQAQQSSSLSDICGAGGESEADLDLNFLRDLRTAKSAGLAVYWLGTQFTVEGQKFVGPYGEPDYGEEPESGQISMSYLSWLEGTPGRGGSVSLEVTVYSPEAWELAKERTMNSRLSRDTHEAVTVGDRQADLITFQTGTEVNALWLVMDLTDVVVVGEAGALTGAGGGELSPFINNPDLLVQVMQGLRPYPE